MSKESNNTVVYISVQKLLETAGKDWKGILQDLIDQGLLKSYSNAIELQFEKSKALHIQSVLEFYDAKDMPATPTKSKKDDNE